MKDKWNYVMAILYVSAGTFIAAPYFAVEHIRMNESPWLAGAMQAVMFIFSGYYFGRKNRRG